MSTTRKLLVAAFALAAMHARAAEPRCAPAPASPPPRGTVQTLPVLSVSLSVGSTGHETKRAVYAPPPGWHVRSHRVVVASKYGTVTYAVSTVPAGWDWKADEQAASAGKSSAGGAVSAYKFSGGGQLATSRDANATDHQAVASSHHLLVIDVTARGGGFLQSGSGVELTVLAEMVYLGR
jgi:hypothetical protein